MKRKAYVVNPGAILTGPAGDAEKEGRELASDLLDYLNAILEDRGDDEFGDWDELAELYNRASAIIEHRPYIVGQPAGDAGGLRAKLKDAWFAGFAEGAENYSDRDRQDEYLNRQADHYLAAEGSDRG